MKKLKYFVLRDDHRVSDDEYDTEQEAQEEFLFWKKIADRNKDGTKVTIGSKEVRDI